MAGPRTEAGGEPSHDVEPPSRVHRTRAARLRRGAHSTLLWSLLFLLALWIALLFL
ncbi:MAG: hypothetical protein ABR599_05910 [Gemmatimonadota bacterium]